MNREWATRLAAACGPVVAAFSLALLAGGPPPELAVLGVLAACAGGLTWLSGTSARYRELWVVTGPAIALGTSVPALVITWAWPLAPGAAAALWFGPSISLLACLARAVGPDRAWPETFPAWLRRVPLRVAVVAAAGALAAAAAALGGIRETPWPVALALAGWAAFAAAAAILPLAADVEQRRAVDVRLARLRRLLERGGGLEWLPEDEDLELPPGSAAAFSPPAGAAPAFPGAGEPFWADPDLEARAAGLQRDLLASQDRIAEQNRVLAELKRALADQAARIDRLAAGYRRVREAAQSNLRLLGQVRGDVERSLNDVGVISDSVGQIVGTSQSTDALIDESRQRLREALESMEYVRLSIEDSLDLVEAFAKRSRQIEDVLKDIADIAYFTRILSLNATIEAARAGEQGKGFRFLADEVQKLAQTITQSTSDITALLKLVQQESKQTVESVLRSANQVGEAADTVSILDEALGRIMEELHSMDADLQDAHLMSLRVAETREGAMSALGTLEEGNRSADFAARVVEDVAAEERTRERPALPEVELPGAHPHAPPANVATGPLAGRGMTAPLGDIEWPEETE